MLKASKRQTASNLDLLSLHTPKNIDASFVLGHDQSPKLIKLRPKSHSEFLNSFSFNLYQEKIQNFLYLTVSKVHHQNQSFISTKDSNSWQKQTKKTSIQKNFKEEPNGSKLDSFLDTPSLSLTLKPVQIKQQKLVQQRREVIKLKLRLKRSKKKYSPISKLLELYKQQKGRISLLRKKVQYK